MLCSPEASGVLAGGGEGGLLLQLVKEGGASGLGANVIELGLPALVGQEDKAALHAASWDVSFHLRPKPFPRCASV